MRLVLALQCISVWDFKPIEKFGQPKVFINGSACPCVRKKGGFFVITREFAVPFSLSVYSGAFLPFERAYDFVPADKIITVELVPRRSPVPEGSAARLIIGGTGRGVKIVLGYGYFRPAGNVAEGDGELFIENPGRVNVEGRGFLLKDGGGEEFIAVGAAKDVSFTRYGLSDGGAVKRGYDAKRAVLLPAFTVCESRGDLSIPLRVPEKGAPLWVYSAGVTRFDVRRGDVLKIGRPPEK
ncbi:MAG: hypothetical protein LBI38_02875 [Oscillospiraceae bacterium]|jgi:hypothetical protein|nr:hypothetical protein [Oscillospiraceae bacterium]